MLHPDFPVVDGQYRITNEWLITLNQPHNRRVEDGSLVLWRPGVTVWINIWNNDDNETIEEIIKWISSGSDPKAFDVESIVKEGLTKYSYRLNEKENNKLTLTYNGYIITNDSYVQITVYFNLDNDAKVAKSIIDSLEYVQP
ncbi:hypothetical protein H4J56_18905 [Colwellia sp. BRX8-4]|uniref:hypothetical protein n=1 Tax=Colwellia sp. BRX8-4 TaxID=2759836 RepID=UPI0015F73090|nr:hypothetical protein [Colwellia sp. BRX8-4]MBA6373487.1 hypothetical protein [Colwellia sp. BRX8-4]